MVQLEPSSQEELAEVLRAAPASFEVLGHGTKRKLGRPVTADHVLSLHRFRGVELHEPEELILEAGAATPLADIEALLAKANQQLAFEPPDYSRLLGAEGGGTIGGVLACNLSGPRRIAAGAARDHILRVAGVSGDGVAFQAGARVVKNVTGYDLPKLMAGSYGTLAALTSVTFKVLPRAETQETLVVASDDAGAAVATMSAALGSSCEVSGAAHVPGLGTCLRLEGIAASVADRRDKLFALLGHRGDALAATESRALWQRIRDADALVRQPNDAVWKLSVPPSEAPRVLNALRPSAFLLDWGGGLIWLALPAAVNAHAALTSGHAMRIGSSAAPDAVLQPQAPALAALCRRVKQAFDARGILNPGRL